jgi:hypothetical protein
MSNQITLTLSIPEATFERILNNYLGITPPSKTPEKEEIKSTKCECGLVCNCGICCRPVVTEKKEVSETESIKLVEHSIPPISDAKQEESSSAEKSSPELNYTLPNMDSVRMNMIANLMGGILGQHLSNATEPGTRETLNILINKVGETMKASK